MWFKNLSIFKITHPLIVNAEQLEEKLPDYEFKECGSQDMERSGWTTPLGRYGSMFTHVQGECIMICLKTQTKIMPGPSITEKLNKKTYEIETQEGRKLTRKEKTVLKEDIIFELMPRALTKSKLLYAYIDMKNGYIFVDTPTSKQAERLISLLRETIGSVPVIPLSTNNIPVQALTHWLLNNAAPGKLTFSDNCTLKELADNSDVAKFKGHHIENDEINSLLKGGMSVIQCGFHYSDSIEFSIDEKLTIKKIKLSDVIRERIDNENAEDAVEQFDIDFSIMTLEIEKFISHLVECFGGIAQYGKEADEQTEMTGLNQNTEEKKTGLDMDAIAESGDPVNEFTKQCIEHVLVTRDASVQGLKDAMECSFIVARDMIEKMQTVGVLSAPNDQGIREVIG